MKARFLSIAERELKEAMEFYEGAKEGLGAEFLAEIEAAVSLIETHPAAWTALSPCPLEPVVAEHRASRSACCIKSDLKKF